MKQTIISHRFAVTVIAILFGASALGWILTELIPPDVPYQRDAYRELWGETRLRIVEGLSLHDPFHSSWYRAVLGLFFAVLALCLLTRWRSILLRSFRAEPPGGPEELRSRSPRLELSWREVKRRIASDGDVLERLEDRYGGEVQLAGETIASAFDLIAARFRSRGYHVTKIDGEGGIRFAATAGRWRSPGSFLFHVGILVITIGGMVGSFWGETELLYGSDGEMLPLPDGRHSILIERFSIITGEGGTVKDYLSDVSILDASGRRLETATIEVNRPLSFDRFTIYQSSYYAGEGAFRWARVEYALPGSRVAASVRLDPDERTALEGAPLTLRAKRLLPDFRIGPDGPYSLSRSMNNPAVEVVLAGEDRSETGWLFLHYPQFNTEFSFPARLVLADVAPVYYTGLEISSNPGGAVLMAGIALATAGLLLLYLFNYRCVKGVVGAERLSIAASGCRWKATFRKEFERISEELVGELSGAIRDTR